MTEKAKCLDCGKTIKPSDLCYEVRMGYLPEDEDFEPEADLGFVHAACLPLSWGNEV